MTSETKPLKWKSAFRTKYEKEDCQVFTHFYITLATDFRKKYKLSVPCSTGAEIP